MSRAVARWVYALTAVLLPAVLLFSLVAALHKVAINSIYKNVEDISDREMPPTITSFQSGPEVVSTIGGSGEGLNCSLPSLTNMFFDRTTDKNHKRHLVLQRFRQACVFHDLCYRHGLATYGYNQNDCDRILQNAAFRLCVYIRNGEGLDEAERCQTDSKMVLAGVSLGGADAYRAWNRSTYFEFDSDPSRSTGFSVSRVVNHPFKHVDQEKYRSDSDQVILTFENVRSNLSVTCVTCKETAIFEPTTDPYAVSPELRSVGITQIPEALLKDAGRKLSYTTPVWLPPRRRHAAPHLLIDSAGKNHLIWMSRNNSGDTNSCIVVTDAAKLLTYTLPKGDDCSHEADSPLTMVEIDMFATTPLPMETPWRALEENIFATAISAKNDDRNLTFCSRSASRKVDREIEDEHDDRAKCAPLPTSAFSNGEGLGAFQNFAVVRPGQQVLFVRKISLEGPWWTSTLHSLLGNTYSPDGYVLLVDVAGPASGKKPLVSEIKKVVKFNIEDRLDPMMPITRTRDDLRFLSLQATGGKVGVRMIDFAKDDPKHRDLDLVMNDRNVGLHSSWASRPVLVLETPGKNAKTKLVFSRGEISLQPGKPVTLESIGFESESLKLETLVFERDADASPDKPFVKAEGAACVVTYKFNLSLSEFPCYRPFDPKRPMRASPAARMQASQLLVGQFAGPDGYGVAFPDFCLPAFPIILKAKDGTFAPTKTKVGAESDKTRTVSCEPLNSHEYVGEPIYPDPDQTMLADIWPLP